MDMLLAFVTLLSVILKTKSPIVFLPLWKSASGIKIKPIKSSTFKLSPALTKVPSAKVMTPPVGTKSTTILNASPSTSEVCEDKSKTSAA